MSNRLASAAVAAALILTGSAAFAQPGRAPHNAPVSAYDDIVTGSIGGERRQPTGYGYGEVDSAKAGNANQPNQPVPQYGQTSGGPGY